MLESISANDKVRLREVFDAGVGILQEVETLKAGLADTLKSLAEELDVKPSVLNKALRIAFKANLADQKDAIDEVEILLEAAGRG